MTTDPIATARALIAAQPDLCDGCEDFDNPAGVPDPLKLIATLADAVEVGQADAEKWREAAGAHHVAAMREAEKWIAVSAERDGLREELAKTLIQTGDLKIALAGTQAKVAAAYEAAAELVALDHVCDAIRALAASDAQAALDKLLAEARLDGWRAGRDAAAEEAQSCTHDSYVVQAIRALPEPKETNHDPH